MSFLKSLNCRKGACGYAKVIHERKKESIEKKWTSVRDIENNGYLDARLKKERKRKMNKIAHVFLQSIFKFQTREICFKDHSIG